MVRLGLVDYGMGNLHSVEQAICRLGRQISFVQSPSQLESLDALILPGVGSFDPAMKNLEEVRLVSPLQEWARADMPLLGICLGLQLFFESSDEGRMNGLGLFKGPVKRLPNDQAERVPHMGWSSLQPRKNCPFFSLDDVPGWMYFVHSFAAVPAFSKDIAGTTAFGNIDVCAVVWKGRIGACQFHPEKSSDAGQKLLKNWLNWLDEGAETFL